MIWRKQRSGVAARMGIRQACRRPSGSLGLIPGAQENIMHSLNIQAMQWQPVADISAVQSLQADDLACFRELRDVLLRYGALERFGISLIHRHFDIDDDEELMEYTDAAARTLTVKPVKKSDIDWNHTTITNWKLTEDEEVARIGCGCARNSGGHLGYHRGT
ncbi:hypothetical protein GQ37_025365 [Janthinobacterium sp. BJB1]|nr:hypothetical protein GQ37_025365 [Janthinobacterium sp. BJB1]